MLEKYNVVKFSIIIPFKNEASNLTRCIESLIEQHYSDSDYEIILVDDHSDDGSQEIPGHFTPHHDHISSLINEGSGKKAAIATGVKASKYAHIITVDADTSRGRMWLAAFSSMFNYKGVKVVAGGMLMIPRVSSAFHYFQAMDYCGTMALSMVAMRKNWFKNGSGGNLGFTKDIYLNYAANANDKNVASGDDVFLIHHAGKEAKNTVIFPKNREILSFTHSEASWSEFIQQRSRWAGKSFAYKDLTMTLIWGFVWIANLLLPVLLVLSIVFGNVFLQLFAFSLMTKLLADLVFLKSATNYFDKTFFKYFFIAELYHVNYVIIVGINALLGRKFDWKGSKFKK